MSWGNKLLLVFIAFAMLMGTLVYKCTQQNFELVSADYYNEELRFQDKIDGENNANRLSNLSITQTTDRLIIQMPKEQMGSAISGQLWFYCGSNASFDRKIPLAVNDQGQMIIEKSALVKTNYLIKTTWESGKEKYYKEVTVNVL